MNKTDGLKWTSNTRVEKYYNDESYKKGIPDEVVDIKGNTGLLTGIETLWNLALGKTTSDGVYPFNASNSFLGVGNSLVEASSTQTGLQGTSKAYAGMDQSTGTTFPSLSTNIVSFRAVFGPAVANFAWNEWGILNGDPTNLGGRSADTIKTLNRKVESMGTKVSGATWVLIVNASILP